MGYEVIYVDGMCNFIVDLREWWVKSWFGSCKREDVGGFFVGSFRFWEENWCYWV